MLKSDEEFINKQKLGDPMEDKTPWTSITAYYKGFLIKKSWPENVNRVTIMAEIDDLIKAGFKPSWNEETNKGLINPLNPQASVVAPAPQTQKVAPGSPQPLDGYIVPCKYCKGETTYKEFTSKKGNYVKGYFCDNTNLKCLPHYVK